MISWSDLYNVLAAVLPLYFVMILAYGSVKWCKIFTPEQCSGISRFVALFAVPFLALHLVSSNNPYTMNLKFIVADVLQKFIISCILFVWCKVSSKGCLDWSITLFSLSTLPNTLVMGVPLLEGMYGKFTGALMVQVVVLQFLIWFTIVLVMYEIRGARILIAEKFQKNKVEVGEVSGSAAPLADGQERRLPMEVEIEKVAKRAGLSLDGNEPMQTKVEIEKVAESARSLDGKEGMQRKDEIEEVAESTESECLQTIKEEGAKPSAIPSASVIARLIGVTVGRKLIQNPNTYASLIGLIWSLISFRWKVAMPTIVANSISILSNVGLGMAMFSLGLFMALQPKMIACGKSIAVFSMVVRFLMGPAVMAVAALAVGLRGVLLRVAIVQAALPPAIVSFVYAQKYNVHSDILSTGVIFGMFVALPACLVYYILLGL